MVFMKGSPDVSLLNLINFINKCICVNKLMDSVYISSGVVQFLEETV